MLTPVDIKKWGAATAVWESNLKHSVAVPCKFCYTSISIPFWSVNVNIPSVPTTTFSIISRHSFSSNLPTVKSFSSISRITPPTVPCVRALPLSCFADLSKPPRIIKVVVFMLHEILRNFPLVDFMLFREKISSFVRLQYIFLLFSSFRMYFAVYS